VERCRSVFSWPCDLLLEAIPGGSCLGTVKRGPGMWKSNLESKSGSTGLQKTATSLQSIEPTRMEDIIAYVGKGVEFKGVITYNGTVRIDGLFDGEIHAQGVLLVGEDAVITAKVSAATIISKGKITGEVAAHEKIKLLAPAMLHGSVKTPMLSMEEGVLFNGSCEMAHAEAYEADQEPVKRSVGSPVATTKARDRLGGIAEAQTRARQWTSNEGGASQGKHA
jgi:cytoskeletal protein CcmA (bactofilin family)